jgi:dihydroflavonol-4-reductase
VKILVTGATGFIGAHSMAALLAAGFAVRALVRSEAKLQAVTQAHGIMVDDVVVGDVTDKSVVDKALDGCDGVIHTAAMISTHRKDAELVLDTNVNGTKYVIGGAVEAGLKHIVHVSSITALYQRDARYLSGELLANGHIETPYGKSKVLSEKYVRELQDAGHPVNITYPGAVIGPLDFTLTEPHQGLVFLVRRAAIIPSTGIQYVDVRDVAEANARIIALDLTGRRIPMGGHFYTWRTLANTLETITGRYLPKPFLPTPLFKFIGKLGDWLAMIGVHSTLNSEGVEYASHWVCTDDSFYFNEMGGKYRNESETMADALFSLWEMDHLTRMEVGLLAARLPEDG